MTLSTVLLSTLLLIACARPVGSPSAPSAPVLADSIAHVGLETEQSEYFRSWRARLVDHKVLPDEEAVLCLYGVTRNDTAFIGFFRSTPQKPAAAIVYYEHCDITTGLGALRYLGIIHPHNPDSLPYNGCYFSRPDSASFSQDTFATIDLVVCAEGIIWRSKRRLRP